MRGCRALTTFVACSLLLVALRAGAEERAIVWTQSGTLAAPEAVQAAAGDRNFVYAISSTQVAKYDRQSGERVAVSTGPATHLNSGFLRKGRLYCAHSNYPRTPEQSEVKVLDVETMELSALKDFGNFGGSLTWVIRREGRWWCNFARYGQDNRETFLVQFDDDWMELARYTYPSEVIRELRGFSLSGGIWRGDSLLVTGHDDPVLFELKLPKTGSVLDLVGKQQAPFTGQGIAADPLTGSLVGIHRAKRQVVFAAADPPQPLRLRVLTYNIHHAEGIDGQLDLERIARVIESVDPDLVALQEVDCRVERTGSVDQPAELARLTGMEVAFGGNIALQGGDYGNAVLSCLPIRRHQNHKLPCFDNGEQRGVLELEIELPGEAKPLLLLATHLDHRPDHRERIASAEAISKLIADRPDQAAILAGDLNATPDSPPLEVILKDWHNASREVQPTIPVRKPSRQIDYVLVRPASRWRVVETKVLDEAVASDHRALLAVVEWLPENVR